MYNPLASRSMPISSELLKLVQLGKGNAFRDFYSGDG